MRCTSSTASKPRVVWCCGCSPTCSSVAPVWAAGLDWKTSLQELTAERGLGVPAYEITSTGPDHNKEFTATTVIAGHAYGSGIGRSKKEAEQKAAGTAYKALTDVSTTEA